MYIILRCIRALLEVCWGPLVGSPPGWEPLNECFKNRDVKGSIEQVLEYHPQNEEICL